MAKVTPQLITRVASAMRKFAKENGGGEVVQTEGTRSAHGEDRTQLKLTMPVGEGMSLILDFYSNGSVLCETTYKAKGKEFTRNRLGVDDSFYYSSVAKLPEEFARQLKYVQESQARLADTKEVNLGPTTRMMNDKQIADMVATLKAGKTFSVTPAGFGTGYSFTIRFHADHRRYYSHLKASYELERLVGQRVFISAFDCD
jgi:hypothetical protein